MCLCASSNLFRWCSNGVVTHAGPSWGYTTRRQHIKTNRDLHNTMKGSISETMTIKELYFKSVDKKTSGLEHLMRALYLVLKREMVTQEVDITYETLAETPPQAGGHEIVGKHHRLSAIVNKHHRLAVVDNFKGIHDAVGKHHRIALVDNFKGTHDAVGKHPRLALIGNFKGMHDAVGKDPAQTVD